jgi:hypothetical protein
MPSAKRLSVGAALLLLLIATPFAAASAPAASTASPEPEVGDFAGLVDIGGGRSLYLECRGAGSPTVILEAGYRSPATV